MLKPIVLVTASLTLLLGGCGAPAAAPLAASPAQPLGARSFDPPAHYYQAAVGKTGKALLLALNGIVAPHRDLGYDGARDVMFAEVDDLDHDDVVTGVYSGRRGEQVTNRQTAYLRGLNAEHTWPQSLGATGPAKADLHHLFPSDIAVNGKRSSFPMGEVRNVVWEAPDQGGVNQHSRLGTDASGAMVWEPRPMEKGNVARALLYFYTCYAASGGGANLGNFRRELPLLAKWSQLDPVDDDERARNAAIQQVQGNRNPYVDHPEWVETIQQTVALSNLPRF